MIPKRRFSYYCALIWRDYLIGLPGIVFEEVACWLGRPLEMRNEFQVFDPWDDTRKHFSTVVDAAIDLIAASDWIRYKRVQAEIRRITNGPAIHGSTYGRAQRSCSVDLRCFSDRDDPDMTVKLLASALIREATVGHLARRGILRTKRNQLRFRLLCCKEAQRFLQRLGMTKTPYDPENLTTLSRGAFWKQAVKEIHGVLVRKPAAEATESKQPGTHREG